MINEKKKEIRQQRVHEKHQRAESKKRQTCCIQYNIIIIYQRKQIFYEFCDSHNSAQIIITIINTIILPFRAFRCASSSLDRHIYLFRSDISVPYIFFLFLSISISCCLFLGIARCDAIFTYVCMCRESSSLLFSLGPVHTISSSLPSPTNTIYIIWNMQRSEQG